MAVPVLFTAELFPFAEIGVGGTTLDTSVVALNTALGEFFTDKVDLAGTIPSGAENLVGTDTVIGSGEENTENVVYVTATVAVGFRGVTPERAAELAAQFSHEDFPHIKVEVVNDAEAHA